MERTVKIIFNYVINSPDWQEIEATITESSGDYDYWPVLQTLTIVHRTDTFECWLYFDQLVDDDFDLTEIKELTEQYAKEYLWDSCNPDWIYQEIPF